MSFYDVMFLFTRFWKLISRKMIKEKEFQNILSISMVGTEGIT